MRPDPAVRDTPAFCGGLRGSDMSVPGWEDRLVPPRPGDVSPGIMAKPERCWRMVYSEQLQGTHCDRTPSWTGRHFSPKGDRWWRVWACRVHLDGLTGVRQFGGRRV